MKITNIEIDAISLTFRWNNILIGLSQVSEIQDLKTLDGLSYINNKSIKQELLLNPNLTSKIIARFAKDDNPKICSLVASHPNTDPSVLAKLAKKEHWTILLEVAKNPKTPRKVLSDLAKSKDSRIRSAVAKNPNTYHETLLNLLNYSIKANEKDVLLSLASNINSPNKVFEELFDSDFVTVRRAIAMNPNTPIKYLKKLAEDDDLLVRKCVIKNPSTTQNVLDCIFKKERNSTLCSILSKRLAS